MTDPHPAIAVRQVNFSHGRRCVLHGIDADFAAGRHYVVAGPNGAGKTTLLGVLAGLLTPASGTVTAMGRPLAEYRPPEWARYAALAPQEDILPFAFTVREMVAMGRRPYLGRWGNPDARDWAAVDRALADTHLDAVAGKAVTALSGGERRRSVVARALAQDTPILFLDEPDSGLDIAHAMAVMALARRLAGSGRLVVTVSHDLNLAARYADRLLLLKEGRVAAAGPVAETFREDLLSRVYDADARVRHDDFTGAPAVSFAPRH